MTDLATEKSRVYKDTTDERRRKHRDQRSTRWYWPPSPTHERAQGEYSENVSKDVCLVAHLLMGVNIFAANSRKSAYGLLRRIAAQVGRCPGDCGPDENH